MQTMINMGKFLGAALLPLLLAACATPIPSAQTGNESRDRLLSGEALPAPIRAGISQPDDDVLGLSADMIRFAEQATASSKNESAKIDALLRALIQSPEKNFIFDPAATYTAAQTFEHDVDLLFGRELPPRAATDLAHRGFGEFWATKRGPTTGAGHTTSGDTSDQ